MRRILIIEDDKTVAELERDFLNMSGYEVDVEDSAVGGVNRAINGTYILILLDSRLPGMSGIAVCQHLREKLDIPILLLSSQKDEADIIRSFGAGADDYIQKPFSPSELTARVNAHIKRFQRLVSLSPENSCLAGEIRSGNLLIQPGVRRVSVNGQEVDLRNKEFEILLFLARNAGVVLNKETIYERIWGLDSMGDNATVAVHINRLREKLEQDPSNPRYILTVWGAGYRFAM